MILLVESLHRTRTSGPKIKKMLDIAGLTEDHRLQAVVHPANRVGAVPSRKVFVPASIPIAGRTAHLVFNSFILLLLRFWTVFAVDFCSF